MKNVQNWVTLDDDDSFAIEKKYEDVAKGPCVLTDCLNDALAEKAIAILKSQWKYLEKPIRVVYFQSSF